jgi:DNA polymerase-3 subunit epsilon
MIVLGIDFETTGLNPDADRVIEVGAVTWDTNTAMPLRLFSEFLWEPGLVVSEEVTAIHGITYDLLADYGRPYVSVFTVVADFMPEVEAVVGHNCTDFDKRFWEAECKRYGIQVQSKTWIDTAMDLKYPEHITTRKLMHLAAEHGFLNTFSHRAIFDVMTMLQIFQKYDPVAALEYAKQPMMLVQALVSYDDREKAKARGYRWQAETKRWLKPMRLPDVAVEKAECGFKIQEVENGR